MQDSARQRSNSHSGPCTRPGLEQPPNSTGKTPLSETGAAESGAVGARNAPVDVGLAKVIQAWPRLTAAMRARIQELIATR